MAEDRLPADDSNDKVAEARAELLHAVQFAAEDAGEAIKKPPGFPRGLIFNCSG